MKSFAYLALIATAGLGIAAHAADAADKTTRDDPDKLICRAEEQTGSRLVKNKRCLTKAQWDEERRVSRLQIEQNQAGRYKNN